MWNSREMAVIFTKSMTEFFGLRFYKKSHMCPFFKDAAQKNSSNSVFGHSNHVLIDFAV